MDTASISDAMDKLGIHCGLLEIQAVVEENKICGEAFTVHYIPCGMDKGNVGDFIDDVEPGQVVVIDNSGRTYCTVWGDIILGDDSGVLVVPKEKAEEVLALARLIEKVEQQIIAEVKSGSPLKAAREKLGYHKLQSKEE